MTTRTDESSEIPTILRDSNTGQQYQRSRFLGKGGFGKCYETKNLTTLKQNACKIVSKKLLTKTNQKEKMTQEITIHKTLNHPNVVRFICFFEDSKHVFIILELCKQRSMMEMQRRRVTVTDYECRFYMHQILEGLIYLHENRIIHRDLKLGNLFLNDQLNVKIGDFGLATRLAFQGERKKTLCGTPNYIAPEILNKKGHSYEVDIWSIGCVMFTLLIGRPPFETKTLKDTYQKIRDGKYTLPMTMRKSSAELIIAMLQSDPEKRPSARECAGHQFFKNGFIPKSLPISCLSLEPRTDQLEGAENKDSHQAILEIRENFDDGLTASFMRRNLDDPITSSGSTARSNFENKINIDNLYMQLTKLLNGKPKRFEGQMDDENTDPSAMPLFWISKWVDYSDKYGFGYQLCDDGMGVMFNDTTKLIMLANAINVHYIDRDGKEMYMTVTNYPKEMSKKKMQLLLYFKRYMSEHLVKAGGDSTIGNGDVVSRPPHLNAWFRTNCAVIMHLTNGSVQINFSDHQKIILCPLMSAVTFIDNSGKHRTFKFQTISDLGCTNDLYQKMRYAHDKIKRLREKLQ